MTAEQLDKILDWSRTEAREDVVKRTAKTEALGKAVEEWLADDSTNQNASEPGEEEPPT